MRKVELLGCGMTRGVVPSFDPKAERWALNRLMLTRYAGDFDEWDRWFDLHTPEHIQRVRPDAYQWYQQQDGRRPIFSWSVDASIPGSAAYPKDAILEYFGTRDFGASLSWMLALAIFEGYSDIDLFWFTLDGTDPFHQSQVSSARYWIGQAEGRGIRVTVHGDSPLNVDGPLYGCEIVDGVRVDALSHA